MVFGKAIPMGPPQSQGSIRGKVNFAFDDDEHSGRTARSQTLDFLETGKTNEEMATGTVSCKRTLLFVFGRPTGRPLPQPDPACRRLTPLLAAGFRAG